MGNQIGRISGTRCVSRQRAILRLTLYTRALSLLAHTAFIELVRSSRRFDGESVDARLSDDQEVREESTGLLEPGGSHRTDYPCLRCGKEEDRKSFHVTLYACSYI